jgi:hypothetical protein
MTAEFVETEARAKAFTNEGVQHHRFRVESNGEVLVWDLVAGHYTTCHSLSDAAKKRIRKLAQATK